MKSLTGNIESPQVSLKRPGEPDLPAAEPMSKEGVGRKIRRKKENLELKTEKGQPRTQRAEEKEQRPMRNGIGMRRDLKKYGRMIKHTTPHRNAVARLAKCAKPCNMTKRYIRNQRINVDNHRQKKCASAPRPWQHEQQRQRNQNRSMISKEGKRMKKWRKMKKKKGKMRMKVENISTYCIWLAINNWNDLELHTIHVEDWWNLKFRTSTEWSRIDATTSILRQHTWGMVL